MNWSWTIGKIAGVRVRVHWTFTLLLLWVAASVGASGQDWRAVVEGLAFVVAVFGCIVLHEAGHALMARRFGVTTEDITLLPIGGVARMQRIPSDPWQELWVAVAGPAVTAAIAGVLFAGLALVRGVADATVAPSPTTAFFTNLMWVNLALLAFNLLPAFPLDGGRVLRAVLAMNMNYVRATDRAAAIGKAMAVLFGLVGLFVNPWLLLIAFFVYVGAQGEAQQARVRVALGDATVHDAMMTRFRTLPADAPLAVAADELLAGTQEDFPVVDDAGVRGILRNNDLLAALRSQPADRRVGDLAVKVEQVVDEDDPLESTMEFMQRTGCRSLPVFHDRRLVGVVSLDNIAELVMIRSARKPANGAANGDALSGT